MGGWLGHAAPSQCVVCAHGAPVVTPELWPGCSSETLSRGLLGRRAVLLACEPGELAAAPRVLRESRTVLVVLDSPALSLLAALPVECSVCVVALTDEQAEVKDARRQGQLSAAGLTLSDLRSSTGKRCTEPIPPSVSPVPIPLILGATNVQYLPVKKSHALGSARRSAARTQLLACDVRPAGVFVPDAAEREAPQRGRTSSRAACLPGLRAC